jgi:hypothetical protein
MQPPFSFQRSEVLFCGPWSLSCSESWPLLEVRRADALAFFRFDGILVVSSSVAGARLIITHLVVIPLGARVASICHFSLVIQVKLSNSRLSGTPFAIAVVIGGLPVPVLNRASMNDRRGWQEILSSVVTDGCSC